MQKEQNSTATLFPELWPGSTELQFVNSDKFNRSESSKNLGWSGITSNSITDARSIRVRQDGLKLFMDSKILRRLFSKSSMVHSRYLGKDFFQQYGSKAKFNWKIKVLERMLSNAIQSTSFQPTTDTYQQISETLGEEFKKACAREDAFVKKLEGQVDDIYSYNGVVKIKASLREKAEQEIKHDVYGFRDYAFYREEPWFVGLGKAILHICEKWPSKTFWKVVAGILKLLFSPVLIVLYVIANIIVSWAEKTGTMFCIHGVYRILLKGSYKGSIETFFTVSEKSWK